MSEMRFKDSPVGKIPKEWGVVSLAKFASSNKHAFVDGPFGSNLKVQDYTSEGVRLIQLQNLGEGRFTNRLKKYTSYEKAQELKRCKTFPGDIVIAKMAEPVARACVVPDIETQYIIVADCVKLTVDLERNNTLFTMYAINSLPVRKQAEEASTGTTRKRISLIGLKQLKMPFPPLPEQQKIAAILTSVDTTIEKTQALIDKLKDLKRATMQELFNKGIGHTKFKDSAVGRIPEEWELVKLTDVASYQNGRSFPSKDYSDEGVLLVRPGNLGTNVYVTWDDKHTTYLPQHYWDQYPAFHVYSNEILMNLTAQSLEDQFLGRVCLTSSDNKCLLNQRIARITPKNIDGLFLFWALKGPHFRQHIDLIPKGSKVQHVYNNDLETAYIAKPSIKEQKKIASIFMSIDTRIKIKQHYLQKLQSLKAAMMQDLLTGKVRVKL